MLDKLVMGAVANPATSVVGNALAALSYVGTVGIKFPSNQAEWIQFGISVLIAILSLLMKEER